MANKVKPLSEAQKQKLQDNNLELITEYTGASKPGTCKCLSCGGEVSSPQTTYLINGSKRCLVCKPRRHIRHTIESYIEEIKSKNLTVLEDFKGIKTSIQHKCTTCEYIWMVVPNSIINVGSGCPNCAGQIAWTLERYEEFVNSVEGYKLIEKRTFQGESKLIKLNILHEECGHIWSPSINRFVLGNRCPICSKGKWTLARYKDLVESNPGYRVLENREPERKEDKLKLLHESCGNEWSPSLQSFIHQGSRCPQCASSKGETWMLDSLRSFGIEYQTQVVFDECRDTNVLRFDGGLVRNGEVIALIEYDGIQHYQVVDFSGKKDPIRAKIDFEAIQRRDKIKDLFCKEIQIPLLRIKYTRDEALTNVYIYNFLIETGFIEEEEAV